MTRPKGSRNKATVAKEDVQKSPDKMSIEEVVTIKNEIQEKKEILNNVDGLATELESKASLARQIHRKELLLDKDEALIARGADKDKIAKRIRDIEEIITSKKPTTNEMWIKLGDPGSNEAVQKNIEYRAKYLHLELELQNLKKRLEPENPLAGNLDYVRPDQYGKKKTFVMA